MLVFGGRSARLKTQNLGQGEYRVYGRRSGGRAMDSETIYTLIHERGQSWLAQADDGHLALLLPDPGLPKVPAPFDVGHAVLSPLEGNADIDSIRWLAYRWGEGQTLAERLSLGPLDGAEAVQMVARLLEGVIHTGLLGYAMAPLRVEHVLLKPDGGIQLAGVLPQGAISEPLLPGVAELLFHALSGQPAARDGRGAFPLLSSLVPEIDPHLEAIVAGAMAQPGYPVFRYPLDLRTALLTYLDGLCESTAGGEEEEMAPLAQLLHRMENTDDYPALSRAVGAINHIAEADTEKLQALSSVILRDFSLTNKVLRLANSASHGQFNGGASTISRAVMVLGFNTVKSLALALVLIEHLSNREHAEALKEVVARAFFTSLISRKLAEKCGYRDLEEARVAGMFHLLGKMLTVFYFHDESQEIDRLVAEGEREELATQRQIGMSYAELGMGVAKSWNLPDKLVSSLASESGKPRTPRQDSDWLRLFSNTAAGLMEATLAVEEPTRFKGFLRVRDQFGDALRVSERDLRVAVNDAIQETLHEAAVFGLDAQGNGALSRLRQLAGLPALTVSPPEMEESAVESAASPQVSELPPMIDVLKPDIKDRPLVIDALANCIQEVAETLIGEFRLNDLLRIILETLYRSLGAQRALIATRSVQRNAIVGRFGFGEDIDQFLPRFILTLDDSADVFRVSLAKNADMLIEDIDSAGIQERIPAWFRQIGAGQTFLLMPVVIDRKIVGVFYADSAQAGSLMLGPKELSLCKTLRNQAILAIRQKTPA